MEHKNPLENIPQPELVPIAPTEEKRKPSIKDIEGALEILRREEEGEEEEEGDIDEDQKKPTLH